MKYRIVAPFAWASQHPAFAGRCGRGVVNMNSALGLLDSDEGFEILRTIVSGESMPGGSFTHTDHDGNEWVWFYYDTGLYKNDGATPTGIGPTLTAAFRFAHYNMPFPCGFSGFFNGTNSEALIVRLNVGGTDIEAEKHDFGQPTLAAPSVTNTDGGTWGGTGSFLVRVAMVDKDGNADVFSAPSAAQTVVISAADDSVTVARPTNSRASHWRVAMTALGVTTDTPSAYTRWEDIAYATTSKKYTATLADTGIQAFTDENGTYRQATLPIDGVDSCWIHQGRLFVGSSITNNIAWSEPDNTNHWYSDQVLDAGAESSLSGPVIGGCSINGVCYVFTPSSVHRVYGDLTRDRDGVAPTYAIRVAQEPVHGSIGAVSHGSIVVYGTAAYFMSPYGPAVLSGGRVELLRPEDLRPFLRREVDFTYADRVYGALDPDLHAICWIVPRRVNSSRAFDGASVAGTCDYVLRWDVRHGHWMPPRYQCDLVHLSERKHPASQGSTSTKTYLCGVGPHGQAYRFNNGVMSGGGPTDAASDAAHDGQATTSRTTTTATYAEAGVSNDEYNGRTVTLTYPDDDANYPGLTVQKTILDTSVSGSAVTITWLGALTVPSNSGAWTVRIAGFVQPFDLPVDHRLYIDVPPGAKVRLKGTEMVLNDAAGQDAIA